jgi:hypothetical protein
MAGSCDDYEIEHNIAPAELPAAFAAYPTEHSDGERDGKVEEIRPTDERDA